MDPYLYLVRLNCGHACTFGCVDETVSGGKPSAGKGVGALGDMARTIEFVFCKVRHG